MKFLRRIIFGACLLIALASCGGDSGGGSGVPTPPTPTPTSTAVSGVSLNKTSLTLVEGKTETVTATVTPSIALNKSVTWSSSDNNIAIVDSEGKITAKNPGTVTITVTTADGNKTATLTLKVDLDYITRQKAILKKLFDSLGGSSWTNKTGWNTDADLKDWYGITMSGDKIASIILKSNNLKGKIPAAIGETLTVTRAWVEADTRAEDNVYIMAGLRELDLSDNKISGSIPSELGNLTTLTNLNLSSNNLAGSVPASIGNLTNLTNLNLGGNSLTGAIPAELGNLTNLTCLDLGSNNLTGTIPNELGKLGNLESLDISGNKLSGLISSELQESAMWKNLKEEPNLKQQKGAQVEKEVHVESVSLDKSEIELNVGLSITLVATITPSEANNKNLTWNSSNNEVVSVDDTGKVTARNEGSATITVTTEDNGKTAECIITVMRSAVNSGIEGYGEESQGWGD